MYLKYSSYMPTMPRMATVSPSDRRLQAGLFKKKVRTEDIGGQSQSLHVSHHPQCLFRLNISRKFQGFESECNSRIT